jgi:hypothetical protein
MSTLAQSGALVPFATTAKHGTHAEVVVNKLEKRP